MVRNNWTREEVEKIYNQPFLDLVYQAATVHRENFDPNEVQISTLLSIKTGGCPEDCSYCTGSALPHECEGAEVASLRGGNSSS